MSGKQSTSAADRREQRRLQQQQQQKKNHGEGAASEGKSPMNAISKPRDRKSTREGRRGEGPVASKTVRDDALVKAGGVKKRYRFHPGTRARREIIKSQRRTDLMIRRLPFQRLIRELAQDVKADLRFTKNALLDIQEATEGFLVDWVRHSFRATRNRNRKTLMPKDLQLAFTIIEAFANKPE